MVKIEADSADIENILKKLVKTVTENGGYLNPALSMVARDGHLSIEAENIEAGEDLIQITEDMLIPMNKIDLRAKGGQFDLHLEKPESWSSVQRAVTDITFEMFNMNNKVDLQREASFWVNMAPYPDILKRLMEGRTRGDKIKTMLSATLDQFKDFDLERYLCKEFVKSRVLGFKSEKTGLHTNVIMTVIDFLNHHMNGACFRAHDRGVNVGCAQPIEGRRECFAFYRPLDPFDSLLNYGFVDKSSSFIRSIPMILETEFGRLDIRARGDLLNTKKLAEPVKDLRFFMPVIDKQYDIVSASHLYVPGPRAPHALRRVLGVLIGRLAGPSVSQERGMRVLEALEREVIERNRAFYDDLLKDLNAMDQDCAQSMMLRNVKDMVEAQQENLNNYLCFEAFQARAKAKGDTAAA